MKVENRYQVEPIPKNPIPGDPNAPNYGTNNIFVTLKDGSQVRTTYAPGLNPMQNQYVLGPKLWSMAASMFKTVNLNERAKLRINADFLNNVFNMPGTPNAGSNGVLDMNTSANSPRMLQLTMRLTW